MSVATVPLASRPGFRTTDVEVAREQMSAALSPHRLNPLARTGAIDVVHHMAGLGMTSFHYIDYGGDVEVSAQLGDYVLVQIPLEGTFLAEIGAHSLVATPDVAAVTSPGDSITMRYRAPNPRLMIRIDRALLDSRLALALGEAPPRALRLDPALDLTKPGSDSWRTLVDTVIRDLEATGPLSRSPLAAASLELAVVDGLLAVHAGSHSALLDDRNGTARPRTLRRAMDLIEDRCAEPLTTADVAEAVGVSVRSLQEAFHTHLGTTPMAYLRATRIRRIHHELVVGGEGVTVTDVMLRWGITHAGRFAQDYRRTFGRTPSETLRQGG